MQPDPCSTQCPGACPHVLCTPCRRRSSHACLLHSVQVKRLFGRCRIVGTRFPIALVHSGGLILEVSSFGTKAKRDIIPTDAATYLSTPAPRGKVGNSCNITRC